MKLRMIKIQDEGLHKVLIVDDDRNKIEGKLVAWVTAAILEDAIAEAKDVSDAILRNGHSLAWN